MLIWNVISLNLLHNILQAKSLSNYIFAFFIASSGQYKCAVFYENLPKRTDSSQTRKLSWIGGLPDALRKTKVQKSAEIRATFGNLKPSSFWFDTEDTNGYCKEDAASSRCYVAVRTLPSAHVNNVHNQRVGE